MIFRYPGGKGKLVPLLLEILPQLDGRDFHDVFVGGGSVALGVAKKYPDCRLRLNDFDENIASFWKMFTGGYSFARLYALLERTPTIELFQELRAFTPFTVEEKAYLAIFFNRTTFSGIAMASPIGGLKQTSQWTVDCRYSFDRLHKEIERVRQLLEGRVSVANKSVTNYLTTHVENDSVMYLDPPYYKQGKNLYPVYMQHSEHAWLASALQRFNQWILSYDACPEVDELYAWAKKREVSLLYSIRGRKTNWRKGAEYLITP
jgi:DNA adenine methylase